LPYLFVEGVGKAIYSWVKSKWLEVGVMSSDLLVGVKVKESGTASVFI